jgi:hypothetical protein
MQQALAALRCINSPGIAQAGSVLMFKQSASRLVQSIKPLSISHLLIRPAT